MIYLVRHGETIWNREGRQQGHFDSPLTPTGIAQAQEAGQVLRHLLPVGAPLCIETSPLGRARQTAEILCSALGLSANALVVAPLLIEHHLGVWQGLTHAEIDVQYPGARQARKADKWHYVVPDGESYALVDRRVRQWLAQRRHASVTIAVTHAMCSRTLQGAYGGFSPTETLNRSHRQDRLYWLHDGQVDEIRFGIATPLQE
jgi:probable phosphoglycerate mutase